MLILDRGDEPVLEAQSVLPGELVHHLRRRPLCGTGQRVDSVEILQQPSGNGDLEDPGWLAGPVEQCVRYTSRLEHDRSGLREKILIADTVPDLALYHVDHLVLMPVRVRHAEDLGPDALLEDAQRTARRQALQQHRRLAADQQVPRLGRMDHSWCCGGGHLSSHDYSIPDCTTSPSPGSA